MTKYTLSKRKDTGSWVVNWFENGKRKRKSLGKITKTLAEQIIQKLTEESILGTTSNISKNPSDMHSILKKYFDHSRDVIMKNENSCNPYKFRHG